MKSENCSQPDGAEITESQKSERWSEEFVSREPDETKLNTIWGESSENVDDADYSNQFWQKLQTEWEKLSKTEGNVSWEKEYSDFFDPFRVR